MDEQVLENIMDRLDVIERDMVRVRQGVITSTSPLQVDIGNSGVPVNAKSINAVSLDETVWVLKWRGDLLILGGT